MGRNDEKPLSTLPAQQEATIEPHLARARGGMLDEEDVEAWFEDRARGICPPYTGRPRRPKE